MRRLAKAVSALTFGRSGDAGGRHGRALACLLGLLVFAGSSAPAALAAQPPLATTDEATVVADEGATLAGKVNPNGVAVATCRFEYGTSSAYGAVVPCLPEALGTGTLNVPVSAPIENLEPGTTYHYRVTAASVNGATQGADRTFTTTGTPVCQNAARRFEQGIEAIQLPQCMALEQVSPPRKFSQRAAVPTIAADGSRIMFKSLAALAETPGNISALFGDSYVAERGNGGWGTLPTSPPPSVTTGWDGGTDLARSFDPTLSCWAVFGSTLDESLVELGIGQFSRGCLGGFFQPLSPMLFPVDGGSHGGPNVRSTKLQGASADHTHFFFAPGEPSATYLLDDPAITGTGAFENVYLTRTGQGGPSLELMSRDEVGADASKAWGGSCGARIGGIGGSGVGWRNQGAVSADGTTVYFTTRPGQEPEAACNSTANALRIMQRSETAEGVEISELIESECSTVPRACPGAGNADLTSGSPLITNLTVNGGAFEEGMTITGAGVPFGAKIDAVISATELELSANATATASGVALTANEGDDFYQGASVDQTKVYFTTNRQLAVTDLDANTTSCSGFFGSPGCDLYLYDSEKTEGQRLTQVSAGHIAPGHPNVGEGANAYGTTTAISGDGSHVYFVAGGVLTPDPNPEGKTADEYLAAEPKLYAWDANTATTRFIGAMAATDIFNLWGSNGTWLNAAYPVPVTGQNGSGEEVGGSGSVLAFQTRAALTGDDTDGGRIDIYRYDADGTPPTLMCVSCRPGGPDSEPFDVFLRTVGVGAESVPGTAFAEQERWVSEDGDAITLRTDEALVPGDLNGETDDYLWRQGELTRLPGTTLPLALSGITGVLRPAVLSHDGDQVAFTAFPQLLPSDIDTAADVYVARVGGGFEEPEPKEPCAGEAGCRPSPTVQPAQQGAAASETAMSRGNVAPEVTTVDCSSQARRAANLSRRAKALRRSSANAPNPVVKRRAARKARKVAKRAKRVSAGAKRCRRGGASKQSKSGSSTQRAKTKRLDHVNRGATR